MAGAMVQASTDKITTIENVLTQSAPRLRQLMPSQALDKPDMFIRAVIMAMRQTPALRDCDPASIVLATAQACSLGLTPNTPLGLSYLVPYGTTCQLIPGYKGLVRLAIQSGEVKAIDARVVYGFDTFEMEYGLDEKLVHKPGDGDRVEANVKGAYAIAKLANGERKFEWMTKAEIDGIRARSKAGKSGPWVTDYTEMARKTAIRRLCKGLPLSEENLNHQRLGKALEVQAKSEAGEGLDMFDLLGEDPEQKPIKGSLAEKAGAPS